MSWRMDVIAGMNTVLPFSRGESYTLAELERRSPNHHGGMKPQLEFFDGAWRDVMDYLRSNFGALGELEHRGYCRLQTDALREKIERNEQGYRECLRLAALPGRA